jgi:hypothetical protein
MTVIGDMELVKNGNDRIAIYFKYDKDKPKCWVVDGQYQFNKQIVFTEKLSPLRIDRESKSNTEDQGAGHRASAGCM